MTTTVSAGEAAKGLVLDAIKAGGGRVKAQNLAELRRTLGLENEVSIKALQSALWKLSHTDEVPSLHFSRTPNVHYSGPGSCEPMYLDFSYTAL